MKNKILIPIIITIFVLGGGAFIWHQYFRPEEEVQVPPVEEQQIEPPVEEQVEQPPIDELIDPVEEEQIEPLVEEQQIEPPVEEQVEQPPIDEPIDEVVLPEFCDRVITIAQLREITGYEGVFSFEEIIERDPFVGGVKICEIRTAVTLGEIDPSLAIAIISPVVDYTVEENFIKMRDMMIAFGVDAREIEGIGKKAFLMTSPEEGYLLVFIDADIDRIVFTGVSMLEFDYEVALNLAKQVEANLR